MRTNQQAFDGVMNWLTRDGASRCVKTDDEGTSCVYYNPKNNNRCAIGGDLPLEIAKELNDAAVGIEGILNEDVWEEEGDSYVSENLVAQIRNYYDGVSVELLDALQRLHDDRNNWGAEGFIGYSSAKFIAGEYSLVYKYA